MKKLICLVLACLTACTVLAGCAGSKKVNYLVLVNKLHPLPDGWEDSIETVSLTNSVGDTVVVEKKAYKAYEKLAADLEKNDGIHLELDSAYRSIAEQQAIMDNYIVKYGADYAARTVAVPGYSEHQTGIALDLYFQLDGEDVYYNEDMMKHPEVWEKIHAKLAKYGFILRYLEGKEHITGYAYEPWHIRYVDNPKIAEDITSSGKTFEEYLGAVKTADVKIDLGSSSVYTPEELEAAVVQIKCRFAAFDGCELHSIRYAGDDAVTDENLAFVNQYAAKEPYNAVAMFVTDFHSQPEYVDSTLEPDTEYTDYQWWLGRNSKGGWEVVSFGY